MGCSLSSEGRLQERWRHAGKSGYGIGIMIKHASAVPKMDAVGHSDTFIRVDVFGVKSKVSRSKISRWARVTHGDRAQTLTSAIWPNGLHRAQYTR